MTEYRCNTEGCSAGDCENCRAVAELRAALNRAWDASQHRCDACNHSRRDHDDNRKHCNWFDEEPSGFVSWCACTKFVSPKQP